MNNSKHLYPCRSSDGRPAVGEKTGCETQWYQYVQHTRDPVPDDTGKNSTDDANIVEYHGKIQGARHADAITDKCV